MYTLLANRALDSIRDDDSDEDEVRSGWLIGSNSNPTSSQVPQPNAVLLNGNLMEDVG